MLASPAVPRRGIALAEYSRRRPEETLLYRVVQQNLETFLAEAEEAGKAVPRFVERELRAFLDCGILARGFLRVRCTDCGEERLVAASCGDRLAAMSKITLYGATVSFYTGRARSYLIKAGLDYREIPPNTLHYRDNVLPKAGGRRGIPTLETETGEVIRDGAAIIDHYEASNGHRFSPTTPKQRILSRLFDVIGAEGLLRPGLHYRWNFPEQNHDWLVFGFGSLIPSVFDREARTKMTEMAMNRANMAGQLWGAVPATFKIIEELYLELLELLNAHFSDQPYLLGGKPSIGDFGMIAPFYGHLGRDPKPLSLMQEKAIRLFRWVERMNRPELDVGEFGVQDEAYLSDDNVPDTLIAVLKHLAVDFVPETKSAADLINAWIDAQDELPPGTVAARSAGQATFEVRGTTISAMAQPYRFYLLKRVQDEHAALDDAAKAEVEAMLAACDMTDVLGIRLSRDIGRENNMEVWL